MTALIYCPFPDEAAAQDVAGRLLDEGLIVCANIGGGVHAIFDWRGVRDSNAEIGVLFKTDGTLLGKAVERIEALHPYEEPAIFGWPCSAAGSATRRWTGRLASEDGSA